ncbi:MULTISPECIES: hypothetical protein [unclassified Modicisalibacter]|uniref:hypothetical protein n=1 Tax=unclassified Modicisalibacter TaxID=2679913 RepID=UPI001CCDB288|nr:MULTISPECIES: hypothetical protein [unclassified Modicisalibacter]MBZ9559474.1 hypothetical protein [Modicisalibacter sp. R2A 31.J]MBZ9576926.1 hypothetical protein [Modicisalibacter sp. MOD 31.J]
MTLFDWCACTGCTQDKRARGGRRKASTGRSAVGEARQGAGRNRTDFYKLLGRHSLEPGTFKPGADAETLNQA